MRVALAVAAVLACTLLAPALAAAADGSIGGTVTEAAAGHAPIEEVEVCAEGIGVTVDEACADTNAAGVYSIPNLEPGKYIVEFWAQPLGYITQFYNGKARPMDADEVTVASGIATPNINAEMTKEARIEGTVVAAVGKAGLPNVFVCAVLIVNEANGGCDFSDSNGDYVIHGLATGQYAVYFQSAVNPDYVFQFYSQKLFFEEATPVATVGGATTPNIDAELVIGGRIAGTVTNAANGAPMAEIEVCARENAAPNRYLSCAGTNGAGRYTIRGLPSGSYKVEFIQWDAAFEHEVATQLYNGASTLAAAQPVAVTAPNTTPGIDGRFGTPPVVPPSAPPTSPVVHPAAPKPLKCKKGFRKKRAKGKVRCVKKVVKKHHRR
jgi:hypothetical protein